jgi:hypothetical protein
MQQRKHAIASSVFRPRPSRAPRRRSALLRNARMCQLRTLPRPSLVSLRRELLPLRPLSARPASASDAFNSSAGFRSRPSSRSSPTYTNPSTRTPSSAVRAPSGSGLTSCTFYTVIQSFMYGLFSFSSVPCQHHAKANWFCSLQINGRVLGPHQKQRASASSFPKQLMSWFVASWPILAAPLRFLSKAEA